MPRTFISHLSFYCLLAAFALPSCASYFVRQSCNKIDWYEYGKSVAMSGNRLSGNTHVRQCEDAEANINYTALDQGFKKGMLDYCRPDTALAIGRRGEFFAPDMCDGENVRLLKSQHQQGVISYCQKSNGQSAGATGKRYNQICPKELEAEFLNEFNLGRKRYLAATVYQTNIEIGDLQNEINRLENEKNHLVSQLAIESATSGRTMTREMKYDEFTQTYKEQVNYAEDASAQSRRSDLQMRMSSTDSEIANKRSQQSDLRKKIRELDGEMLTL